LNDIKNKRYLIAYRLFLHLRIQAISIASLQVHYYSEALSTQHRYCVGVSHRSATGNCEWYTCTCQRSYNVMHLVVRTGFEFTNEPPRPTMNAFGSEKYATTRA